ncbi:hypothetical protein An07g04510 [Aspergillus niger]|uniref:Uncharacterized protein n=2 Tax=Aspergillus niger TaxID=5061 RepID=A2QN60_ASPNC|nr:hypothetical protein An07g04510 [Aspergillus niger]CAK48201.1 hypothetical protein An07g04510 [Aspergillus niger]
MYLLAFRLIRRIFKSKSKNQNQTPDGINLDYPPPPPSNIPRRPRLKHYTELFLHILQAVFALTTIVLYGIDIHHAHEKSQSADARWVYAIVTGMMGCGTALFYLVMMHWVLKTRTPLAMRERWNLPLFDEACGLGGFGESAALGWDGAVEGDEVVEGAERGVWG